MKTQNIHADINSNKFREIVRRSACIGLYGLFKVTFYNEKQIYDRWNCTILLIRGLPSIALCRVRTDAQSLMNCNWASKLSFRRCFCLMATDGPSATSTGMKLKINYCVSGFYLLARHTSLWQCQIVL